MKYGEIVLKNPEDDKVFLKMYYSTAEPGQRPYFEHHHTECEISSILEGSCQWQVRRRSISCSAGDIMVFGSDEEHYITAIGNEAPLKILNLQFEPYFIWSGGSFLHDAKYLNIFLNHGSDFRNQILWDTQTAGDVRDAMAQILLDCRQARPEYELIVKARLMMILAFLGRHYSDMLEGLPANSGAYLHQIEKVLNYIDANLTRELTLNEILEKAGMSRSCFASVFKTLNGVSVWKYITTKRIELAMQMIRQGQLGITQIAMECGFNTMSNFNRSFKNVTHCTPSEYKRSLNAVTGAGGPGI